MSTPGPWKLAEVQGDNIRTPKIRLIRPVDDRNYEYGAVAYVYGDDYPLAKANARLIAAAPALLEVAKAYEAWEADVIQSGDWSNATVRLTQAQHDRLIEIQAMRNAALSQARGEG